MARPKYPTGKITIKADKSGNNLSDVEEFAEDFAYLFFGGSKNHPCEIEDEDDEFIVTFA